MTVKPSLDELIEPAAKLSPGPEAWAPIFKHYPGLTVEQLAQKFRDAAERDFKKADALTEAIWARKKNKISQLTAQPASDVPARKAGKD
jgi:hypothetical protein